MHRLPRFFSPSHKDTNHMDSNSSKHKSRAPKLERRLAKKNIDYDPSTSDSSSSFSASEETAALRTRSLDLSPFGDRTSFRVQGIDGEFDLICQHLGLSVDDFTIPIAAWEARKALSSSDLLPRSRLQKLGIKFDSSISDTTPPPLPPPPSPPPQQQCESAAADDDVCELSDRLGDSVRVRVHNDLPGSVESFSRGIKGVRPPVLAPPPSISLPVIDNTSSTWDILWSFAPEGDRDSCSLRRFVSSDDENEKEEEEEEEEEEGEEEIVNPVEVNDGVRLGVTAVHSESCSFTTTSNDDDSPSSSTTTDPMNISPNGRFSRVITSWERGELLGRGSFGSVYEGIAA